MPIDLMQPLTVKGTLPPDPPAGVEDGLKKAKKRKSMLTHP